LQGRRNLDERKPIIVQTIVKVVIQKEGNGNASIVGSRSIMHEIVPLLNKNHEFNVKINIAVGANNNRLF
jgi:hypothetical protein